MNEVKLQETVIAYIKFLENRDKKDYSVLETIYRRSQIRYDKTSQFTRKTNQREENVELRVPIPLLQAANDNLSMLNRITSEVYEETEGYGYGRLIFKPKAVENSDNEETEYHVTFDEIKKSIIAGIQDAKYTIWISIAWFTDRDYLNELKKKKEEGLHIRIITSDESSNRYLIPELKENFDVVLVKPHGTHRLHDKFCIIDFEYVMHGSFNWSVNAQGNEEAWMTAIDRDMVREFANQYMKLYSGKAFEDEWEELF